MAILKIISHGKTNAGKRRVLQYVLDPKKTNPDLCAVSGDFQAEEITPQTVYKSCTLTRALFNKVSLGGRTYTHGTIAFAPGEISPEDAAEFAEEFVAKVYPNNQVLTAVHTPISSNPTGWTRCGWTLPVAPSCSVTEKKWQMSCVEE